MFTKLWFLLFMKFSGTWTFFHAVDYFQHWQDFQAVQWKYFMWRSQRANMRLNYIWHILTKTAVTTCTCQPWIWLTGRKVINSSHFVHPLSDTTFHNYISQFLFSKANQMFHCDLFFINDVSLYRPIFLWCFCDVSAVTVCMQHEHTLVLY